MPANKEFREQLTIKAWKHIETSKTGDLTGFGSHTDPTTGNTYRFRVNKLNKEKRTGLKLVPTAQTASEKKRREAAKTYGSEESKKASKAVNYKDTDLAQKADELGEIPLYDEHQIGLQTGVEMPKGMGTDDLANRYTRPDKEFDVFKVKNAKDDFEKFSKRQGNPWASFVNEKTDELQVVNIEEWRRKDDGRYVGIFQDGVTLDRNEVTLWKKAVKTGKLGKFPLKKAAYLLKELNEIPGLKKGLAVVGLTGISALLDVVEAKDGFTELANEEFTAREKVLAGLKAYAATAGVATLTPAAPVAGPTSLATGLLYSGIEMMDAHKVKKKTEMLMSLGLEELPNGEVVDRIGKRHAGPLYDEKTGEWIGPMITQGHVKKQTRRGSR